MKLYNCYYISLHSLENEKALSGYMTEFTSFNVIDSDMIRHEHFETLYQSGENKDKSSRNTPIHTNIILS